MTQTDVMTAAEAAERLGVTTMSITRWAKDGRLKKIRDAPLLFDAEEVERHAALLDEYRKAKAALLDSEAAS
jgi:excisionase family DNA binding protein